MNSNTTTATSNNILDFPNNKVLRYHVPEEFQINRERAKQNYINLVFMSESLRMIKGIENSGIFLHDKEFGGSRITLALEILRAEIYRANGLFHPLGDVLNPIVDFKIDGGNDQQ